MIRDVVQRIRISELKKDDAFLPVLSSTYKTSGYYDVSIHRERDCWKTELKLKQFGETVLKQYEGRFFAGHLEAPRMFTAELDGKQVGWIEVEHQKWNNRLRVWEFLVSEELRGKGIGTILMNKAVEVAREKGARMLVLETQTCNVPAINFYLNYGFELVGFDAAAYSNDDIAKKEVRIELGLRL